MRPSSLEGRGIPSSGGTEEELIFPPPYNPSRMLEEHHPPPPGEADAVPRAGGGNAPVGSLPFTRQRAQREQSASAADSTILPLRATGPPDVEENQPHHYWPFATSDLYNWKAQNPKFSEKPAGLIDLFWYTVLDLKDAFFSLPLAPQSQLLFAFEWHDPEEGYSGQLTWTRLPQGFKNSPTIFDEALHEDLGAPLHDCAGILEQVHGFRTDLTDRPLPDAEATWFTDGSSFVQDGHRYAGAAVVTETDTIWAEALPSGTSAQRAELIALTKALMLGAGKRLNIYTDSHYAFATGHIHGAIYQERGLLMAEGRTIKNKQEILNLLTALWLPAKLAIIHCQGHQKAGNAVARGNRKADQAAKAVALTPVPTIIIQLPDPGRPSFTRPAQVLPGEVTADQEIPHGPGDKGMVVYT
ncbi:uncharacterized protein LOC123596349 [Leopardus geoffroyi]|uniref:uncharacterized protein LOC123596349 n=1 Tax=Leopardus geoffroyi TaxID=46844 RepID=UPI001E25F846|nr:uncharacterized protein LOC123596349 [Leopardus geoffroyi]